MSELRSSLHPLLREELVAKIEQLRQDLAAARAALAVVSKQIDRGYYQTAKVLADEALAVESKT